MNCHAVREALQADFDGSSPVPSVALADHLAGCPACQRLHLAAQDLRRGLCLLASPSAPPGLVDRIVRAVRTDRRLRQRQRLRWARAVALAASVLVLALADPFSPRSR